jgi:copper transport protein
VAILATWGLADHAATGSWAAPGVGFDVIHLGAASIWVGGLVMIVVVAAPASRGPAAGPDSPLRRALPRFSQCALGTVVALAVTGLFAAWRQIGVSWGALTTTTYGRLVIYKVVGFAVLVALAAVSRRAVHGNLAVPIRRGVARSRPGPDLLSRLRTAVGAEVLVALVVLALSAVLVDVQPAKQAYAAPYSTEVKAGPDLLDVVIDPAKAGPVALHVYVLTADGAQAAVPEVRASLSNSGAGISDLTVPLTNAGPGHFLTTGFTIPIRGTWTLRTIVRTTAIDEYPAQPVTFVIH